MHNYCLLEFILFAKSEYDGDVVDKVKEMVGEYDFYVIFEGFNISGTNSNSTAVAVVAAGKCVLT